MLFQSKRFKLHTLLPELERVLIMFHNNFMKIGDNVRISNADVNDEHKWVPLDQVYPGYMASETLKEMLPYQRESFLVRCRDWYREAIHQIRKRIDISDQIRKRIDISVSFTRCGP